MLSERRSKPRGKFTEAEAEFLSENFLGRVATVSKSGDPHVVPVAYSFDGASIQFGGRNLEQSLKFRNLASNGKASFVVDDVVSTRPWKVRGVEVRGNASPETTEDGVTRVRIIPLNIRSWGLGG
jgi:pyridoxamine 5'-phosphate oxidase family protein